MNDITEQFFKTFGIEPKYIDGCKITDEYWNNEELANKYGCFALYMREKCPYDEDCNDNCEYTFDKIEYSEITDRVLLELICIANKANIEVIGETVEETKNKLLEEMIYWKDDIIHKEIQQLFKEAE